MKKARAFKAFPVRIRLLALSFFLSFVFWLMITLNREYSVRLDFAVAFDYPKEGVVVVEPLPEKVMLNVSGVGWDLFKNATLVGAKPLKIALSDPTAIKAFNKSSMFSLFSEQLEDIRLNYVVTDSLSINIQRQVIKPVPVVFNGSSVVLEEGYRMTSPIHMLPDTLYVTGPEEYVEVFPMGYVLQWDSKEPIYEDFREDLPVNIARSDLVRVDASTVEVSFSVEKFARKSVAVQVGALNFLSSRFYRPVLADEMVQISYTVKSVDAPKVLAERFLVVADYKNLDRKTRMIPLEILDYPVEYVSEMDITPSELKVRYEKKD